MGVRDGNPEFSEADDRPKDVATLYSEHAAAKASEAIADWTEQINAIVQDVNTGTGTDAQKFAELEDRLYGLYAEIDDTQYAEVLAQAIAATELAGRYEVAEGLSADDIDFSEFEDFAEALEFQDATKVRKPRNCNPQRSFCAGKSCQTLQPKKDGSHRVYSMELSEHGMSIQNWLKGMV